jgi:putative holliday junction resolvase
MTIAAIDYGRRRLGLAACDPAGIVVYPAGVIQRSSLERDLAVLTARLKDLDASRVIVGLPLNMDGTAGPAARLAQQFAQQLHEATGLEVELYDERLSTFEAEERLKTASKRERHGSYVDAIAAVVILESWLAARHKVG